MLEFCTDISDESKNNNLTLNSFQQSLPFFAISCGEFYAFDRYFTKRDNFDNYLLLVTVEGLGQMIYNGQTCFLEPGSALIIDCNVLQEYRTVKNYEWHFYFLHFNAVSMNGYRNLILKRLTPVMLKDAENVYTVMKEIYNLSFGFDAKTHIMISNHISNILTEMVCSLSSDNNENSLYSDRNDINALQKFIQQNFQKDIHIDDFMRESNLSRHYLIHVFKQQTGISPYQYLHMCRINYAQTLLVTTDLSVSQIAEKAGYNSSAVFIRHFRKFNKITPSRFRGEYLRQL